MNNRNLDAMYHCFVIITLIVGGLLFGLVAHAIIQSFFGIDRESLIKALVTVSTAGIAIWYASNKVYTK